jgi:hypothetical protein
MTDLVPYMALKEVVVMTQYILHYQPRRCLEWGIGGSTVQFSALDCVAEWVGIEHSQEWIEKVNALGSKKLSLHYAPIATASVHYASQSLIDGYVNHPSITGAFDFVFIDGDYRWQCLKKASALLTSRGFCMVHDSARKDMHPHFCHFRHHQILTPGEFNSHGEWHQGLTVLWNSEEFVILP